ncbi:MULTISPECIES: YafY family protein [unclassified Actinotalea]|uniref:helix-turn-helix transcriptional regulator n=1 Tax=unclassified Actinotalea TaxID=2638618 RepID=UPI0015F53D48|nr:MULTISPECIES: WYL domain-containing protein [unclassified Actinotalea]
MGADASPTARALLALELIQAAPGITAERLGRRLGVSERAARRYVEILREAGLPIETLRGRYGGYRAGRGLRLPPLLFTSAEALGLVMAVLDGHHAAADPSDPVGSALGKLVRALPEPVAAQADAVRRTTAPAPDHAAARPDPATTSALVEACAHGRAVRLEYRTEAGTERTFEVDPWAVVVRHARWYLLCRAHHAPSGDAVRAYRVDRVTDVAPLERTFEPPAGLDPVALLEEHLASGWRYPVEVEVEAPADVVRRHVPRSVGRVEEVDGGRSRIVGTTSNAASYAEWLALLPVAYRVAAGDEVRAAVRELGLRAVAASAEPPASPVG